MSIVMQTARFKGRLLDLLGRSKEEAIRGLSEPSWVIDNDGAERLLWWEKANEDTDGSTFSVALMARIYQGIVWAVGVRSDRYLFVSKIDERGDPYFAAVPKDSEHDAAAVNWIVLEEGKPTNLGASY